MLLDKIEVSRRQLGTAIALFLNCQDSVSVHVLACGGGEIAEHLTRKKGVEPFATHILATFPNLKISDVRRLRNQYWNAFKHAVGKNRVERDDEKLFEKFEDAMNDHALFIGWYDYAIATNRLPIEAQVFQAWYFALYPEKLDTESNLDTVKNLFPGLKDLPRQVQKARLRETIEWARKQPDVMNDPCTECSPLVLPIS